MSSTGALELRKVPDSILIVGAGVIGLEMASVWNNYGSKVTVIEVLDRILAPEDNDISKEMEKLLTKKGITIRKMTKMTSLKVDQINDRVETIIENLKTKELEN